MALLPSVCVALTLQPLDNFSRMAAAATCRRMLSDALQPLAWKYAEHVPILWKEWEQRVEAAGVPAYSLVRLAPLAYSYGSTHSNEVESEESDVEADDGADGRALL